MEDAAPMVTCRSGGRLFFIVVLLSQSSSTSADFGSGRAKVRVEPFLSC
uniref:Uncharacterized protein n=1 Tax=Arundo donax TaxID=35708 RepID=A0A0A9GW96_ARUDO